MEINIIATITQVINALTNQHLAQLSMAQIKTLAKLTQGALGAKQIATEVITQGIAQAQGLTALVAAHGAQALTIATHVVATMEDVLVIHILVFQGLIAQAVLRFCLALGLQLPQEDFRVT
jgi:hypothetical protein